MVQRSYKSAPIQVETSLARLVEIAMRKYGCTEEEAARRWFGNSEYYGKWLEEKKAANA